MAPGWSDSYRFFLNVGPLSNVNDRYFHGRIRMWNDLMNHPDYDEFWKARDTRPGLTGTKCAVLTVGGLFDAEDMWGALNTYRAFEKNNPGIDNRLVMGPWSHGMWAGRAAEGKRLGDIDFGHPTAVYFQDEVEFPFFDHYLNDGPEPNLPEALVFETGANRWRRFDQWPPAGESTAYYIGPDGTLTLSKPKVDGEDAYVSDPNRPVPFTMEVRSNRNREYMIADQRFAFRRPDVLSYETAPMESDTTFAGPVTADLFASTSGTDADFVVKVIDVFPDDEKPQGDVQMGGYQMLVRWEVLRGKYRNSYERPEPFKPNRPTPVTVRLNDLMHTFRKGHRMMVQVQSSMFPLIDRNPQRFVDIYKAKASDFDKATIRLYRSRRYPSHLTLSRLR
jgi:putative CocE/NonD family hydrolase